LRLAWILLFFTLEMPPKEAVNQSQVYERGANQWNLHQFAW
jgi:hypothetical protein